MTTKLQDLETLDLEMLDTFITQAKHNALTAIEVKIRQKLLQLQRRQQAAMTMLHGKRHRRPEKTLTNQLFELQIRQLEDVVSIIDSQKKSIELKVA